jgi:hypothetical protein
LTQNWHQSCQVVSQIDTKHSIDANHLPNEFKIYGIKLAAYIKFNLWSFEPEIFWTLSILMYHHDWCVFVEKLHPLQHPRASYSDICFLCCAQKIQAISVPTFTSREFKDLFLAVRGKKKQKNESRLNKIAKKESEEMSCLPRTLSQAFSFRRRFL